MAAECRPKLVFVDEQEMPGMKQDAKADMSLPAFVQYLGSLSSSDKVIKVLAYASGLAACTLRHQDNIRCGPAKHGELVAGLRKIYGDLSLARMVYRFRGTFDAVEAMRSDSWAEAGDDEVMTLLVRLQAASMVAYYPLNHIYWAGAVAPQAFRLGDHECHEKRVAKVGALSCSFWTVYIVIDLYLSSRRLRLVREKLEHVATGEGGAAAREQYAALQRRKRHLVLQFWRNIFYLPNALHWSYPRGLLPQGLVQLFGLVEGVLGLVQSWPRCAAAEKQ